MKLLLRAVTLLVVTTFLTPSPANAAPADPEAERERVRRQRAELTQELDVLRASENELLAAVEALDRQLASAGEDIRAARTERDAAEQEGLEADRALRASEARVAALTNRLIDQAVESFVHLPPSEIREVLRSDTIGEGARRQALLRQMEERDDDTAHALHAAQEGLRRRRDAARRAAVEAAARIETVEEIESDLRRLRREQERLRAGVEERRRVVSAESEALAAEEDELTRMIAWAQASLGPATPAATGPCRWPVSGRVTSGYGSRWGRLHAGMDIAAPTGTPISAAMAGQVLFAGVQGGYGNVVVLDHGGGLTSLYAHQSRLSASTGQAVAAGQQIGAVGSTGFSTGPHLHFETRRNGGAVDPRGCLG